jgi:hypothetical protein
MSAPKAKRAKEAVAKSAFFAEAASETVYKGQSKKNTRLLFGRYKYECATEERRKKRHFTVVSYTQRERVIKERLS